MDPPQSATDFFSLGQIGAQTQLCQTCLEYFVEETLWQLL